MLSINLYQRKQCWNKFALSCSKNISVVKSKFTIRFHGPFDKVRITSSRNTVRKKKHLKTGNVPNFKADWIKINENLVLKIGETKEDGGGVHNCHQVKFQISQSCPAMSSFVFTTLLTNSAKLLMTKRSITQFR